MRHNTVGQRRFRALPTLGGSLLTLCTLSIPAIAAEEAVKVEEEQVITLPELSVTEAREVEKSSLSTAVEALPTQTHVIDAEEIEALPFSDATDLLRSTPGITFGSSSPGGDIGDDISIRGFSSFHGADAAIYVDGVPVNNPNGPNRHGSVDFNWLAPELIERIEITKGPFSALYGNFNLSGAINITTKSSDSTSIATEIGSYDTYRTTGIYGREFNGVTPFLALDYLDRGGYRDNSEYRRVNLFNKFSYALPEGRISLRFNAALRDFDSAGFLFADDVRADRVDRRSANPDALSDYGEVDYYTLVANYVPDGETGLSATVYAGHDDYLFFDTSFGGPSVGGAQIFQDFRRDYLGCAFPIPHSGKTAPC